MAFNKGLQCGQVCAPEGPVLAEPGIYNPQGIGIQAVKALSPLAVLFDEPGVTQPAQMFGNGWARDGKSPGDTADRLGALPEQFQNCAPRWVGQGAESRLRRIGNFMVTHIGNHKVTY